MTSETITEVVLVLLTCGNISQHAQVLDMIAQVGKTALQNGCVVT